MSELKWRLIAMGAVILACSVCYFIGRKSQAMSDKLALNKQQIHVADSLTRSDSAKQDTAKHNSEILVAYRSHVREKVKVVHDTILLASNGNTDGKDSVVAVSPEIAQLIEASDSTIAALQHFVAVQESVIADQRSAIALRDTRIALLESRHNPRTSHGFQIGGGYCATALGNTPCIYAGYGFQVRLP